MEFVHHKVEHNSAEHHKLRLGIPTASCFGKIITAVKAEPSKQRSAYMYELLAEWWCGQRVYLEDGVPEYKSPYMERGIDNEDRAILRYEAFTDILTSPPGFFTALDGMTGCSPDRLIGDDGILEIKSPGLAGQIKRFFEGVEVDHVCQIQGMLLITNRVYVDVWSDHDALTLPTKKVYRDEVFIPKLEKAVKDFVAEMLLKRADLEREIGARTERLLTDIENDVTEIEKIVQDLE